MRVDDRVRAPHLAQRQALAERRDVPRWTAAGMLEAEQQFKRVIGYQELAKLATALERELTLPPNTASTEETAIVATA